MNANPSKPYPAAVVSDDAGGGSFFTAADAQTWDLVIDLVNDRFNSAGLYMTGVTLFQSPFGGNAAPPEALTAVFPAVGYDTYVTAPPYEPGQLPTLQIFNAYVSVGPAQAVFSTTELNVVWNTTPNAPSQPVTATYTIARISLKDRPNPGLPYAVNGAVIGTMVHPVIQYPIPSIPVVPEPCSAFALAAAGSLLCGRRR